MLLARAVVEQRLAREGLAHRGEVDVPRRALGRGSAAVTASSSTLSAVRASPSEASARKASASSSTSRVERAEAALAVGERPAAAPSSSCSAASGFSTTTRERESSAAFTSNDGFSVVAPISTMSPDSTCASSASCCALLKRWISSMKTTVRRPSRRRRSSARAQDLAHLLDAREHRAHRLEVRARQAADHERQRRLARAGRPPEDQRAQLVLLDRAAQRPAGPEDLLLAEDLVERARAHALGERCVGPRLVAGARACAPGRARRRRASRVVSSRAREPCRQPTASRRRGGKPRWRAASYSTSAAATPTFRLSTGARQRDAQARVGAREQLAARSPAPSLPTRIADGAAQVGLVVAQLAVGRGRDARATPRASQPLEHVVEREAAQRAAAGRRCPSSRAAPSTRTGRRSRRSGTRPSRRPPRPCAAGRRGCRGSARRRPPAAGASARRARPPRRRAARRARAGPARSRPRRARRRSSSLIRRTGTPRACERGERPRARRGGGWPRGATAASTHRQPGRERLERRASGPRAGTSSRCAAALACSARRRL